MFAEKDKKDDVDYRVIGLVNGTDTMAVIVDNQTYPLHPSSDASILYEGEAPVAKVGYKYAKINQAKNVIAEEPFLRNPSHKDTYNEFFNRTRNFYRTSPLPTLYKPLPAIHRIDSDLHRENVIPTIHIVGNETEFDILNNNITLEDYTVVSNLTYITVNDEEFFKDVEVSLSGRSSTWFPKRSYSIKLKKKDDLYDYRRLKLRAMATDPSYLREKIGYDIIKSVGLAATEFSFCRVFLNDKELGLFGLIGNYKNPWLANVFADGEDDYKNGNLYQGVFTDLKSISYGHISDLSYYKNISDYALGQYEIKEEAVKDVLDYEPLQNLTKFISEAPTTEPNAVEAWKSHIDVDSVLRSMVLEVMLGYSDGYLTMADNYYLYDNPATKTFFYIPSDLDMIIGSGFFPANKLLVADYAQYPGVKSRPLTKKILAVPEFKAEFEKLFQDITRHLVNPVVLNDYIGNLTSMIKDDVAWDKTLPRVGKEFLSSLQFADLSNSSDTLEAFGGLLGDGFDNVDEKTLESIGTDFFGRLINDTIPFLKAVNGPLNRPSVMSVKEWFTNRTDLTLEYYNITIPCDNRH